MVRPSVLRERWSVAWVMRVGVPLFAAGLLSSGVLVGTSVSAATAVVPARGGAVARVASGTWLHMLGGTGVDAGAAIAVDHLGDVYVTGITQGDLSGAPEVNPGPGSYDIFVAKYSGTGSRIWVHEYGSSTYDYAKGIAVDSAGNAYVTGYTDGQLPGGERAVGFADAFVVKYSTTGSRLWVHQFGAANSATVGNAIAVDGSGDAFVTGSTNGRLPGQPESNAGAYDAFIAKYSAGGTRIWVHRLGGPYSDYGNGIALDNADNAYVAGTTEGMIPGQPKANAGDGSDLFAAKYSTTGTRLWTQQVGVRGDDTGAGIAVDSAGNAYVTGDTQGRLPGSPQTNPGGAEAFVVKYSEKGSRIWVQQLAASGAGGIAVDGAGNVYLTGEGGGQQPGEPPIIQGIIYGFVAKYSTTGTRLFVHQLRGAAAAAIASDNAGNTFVTGSGTHLAGALDPPAGESDIFIARNL